MHGWTPKVLVGTFMGGLKPRDGNVAIYHRYIVDISGVGPSRHDISKRKSNEGKIEKYQPILAIYCRYIGK